jgi:Ca2+-binding EF-hand superfamily protein
MIEEFDPVEEAFNLLDVEGVGHLTVDTFRNIFEKLELGKIEPNEEKIFLEVATTDDRKEITLADFRKILDYNAKGDEDVDQGEIGMDD